MILLLLCCCCLWGAAEESDPLPWPGVGMQATHAHPLVRGGLHYRIDLAADGPVDALIPPLQLEVRLLQQGKTIAATDLMIDEVDQWGAGIACYLVPPRRLSSHALRLTATLTDGLGELRGSLERPLTSVADLGDELEALIAQGASAAAGDPLPRLWLEQASLLYTTSRRLPDCRRLRDCIDRLRRLPASAGATRAQAQHEDAFVATSDGSVQPYRLHRAAGDVVRLLVWLAEVPDGVSKISWPAIDQTRLDAALAAGFSVVEVYPAGDTAWTDLGRRRIEQTLAALGQRHPALATAPRWCYAEGRARDAAIALGPTWQGVLLAGPGSTTPNEALLPVLGLIDQRPAPQQRPPRFAPDDQTAWRWLATQERSTGPAPLALADYASGPFTVVLGRGDQAAASERIRDNAARFLTAWSRYSQGDAERRWADEATDLLQADRNLVCFGNPRSNRLLAALFPHPTDLPLRWSDREVRLDGGDAWLRDQTTSVLILPHPRHPRRLVYICDGQDIGPLIGPGLPLAGLEAITILDRNATPRLGRRP